MRERLLGHIDDAPALDGLSELRVDYDQAHALTADGVRSHPLELLTHGWLPPGQLNRLLRMKGRA